MEARIPMFPLVTLGCLVIAQLLNGQTTYPQILVLDPFTDGDVTVGSDPLDVHWHNVHSKPVFHHVVEDTILDPQPPYHVAEFLINDTVSAEANGYLWFVLPEEITLAVGEAIEVSYRLRFAGGLPRADASRTGVSLAYRATGNSPWSDAGNHDYFFLTSFGSAGTLGTIRKDSGAQLLNAGGSSIELAQNAASINLGNDVGSVLFEVARVAENTMRIRYRLSGGPIQEAIDDAASFFNFDRVLFRYRWSANQPLESLRMDDVTVRLIEADLSERQPTTWYVSPTGDDGATGDSIDTPFRTITRAVQWTRPGDTVRIRGGTYSESLLVQASGTAESPIRFTAHTDAGNPEAVIISGFDTVTPGENGVGLWQQHAGDIWKITLPAGMTQTTGRNLVSLDATMLIPARWPDATAAVDFDRTRMATATAGSIDLESKGVQAPYTTADFYTGTYTDPELAQFATDSLVGAHIDLCAGHNWWPKTGVVIANDGDLVTFRFRFNDNWNLAIDTPNQMDRFAVWGHLAVLNQPGEFFLDVQGLHGPSNTLYVHLSPNATPIGSELQILRRLESIKVDSQSHISFEYLKVHGGTVSTGSDSTAIDFDHIEVDYGSSNRNLLIGGHGVAVLLRGTHHTFSNGRIAMTDGRAIEPRGSQITLFNNVMHTATSHLLSLDTSVSNIAEYNTGFDGGGVGASIGAEATLIRYNHFYDVGKRGTDLAVMNTWNGGDMQGTEVAYNWAHSNRAPHNPALKWWGGQGIRLDSGGAPRGCSNALIHHNVIWATTSRSSITAWGLEEGMDNFDDSKIYIFHNTMEGDLVFGGRGSVKGSDLRRNIADGFNNVIGDLTGATFVENLFSRHEVANNLYANPAFVSTINRNYQLRPESIARDHGNPIPSVSEASSGAYLGAYNPDTTPWRPGARVRSVDLPRLVASIQTNALSERFVRLSGLPLGRTFNDTFSLRVAGRNATAMTVRYHFDNHSAEALFAVDLSGLTGDHHYEVSLDGVTFITPYQSVLTISQPSLLAITSNKALPGGASSHSLNVVNVAGDQRRRIPLSFSGLSGNDLSGHAIPWVVDTRPWIADGMAPDGSDLRFYAFDGRTPIRHHIESGINQSNTLVWLMQDNSTGNSDNVASFEDRTILYLSYGYAEPHSADDANVLTDSFPALAAANRLLHLRANDLAGSLSDGDPVAVWPDRSPDAHDVSPSTPDDQPVYRTNPMGGLPAIAFDGIDDHFNVNGAAGLGTGPGRFFVVYRNPDPGDTKWQRLYSARTDTSMADYIGGYSANPPADGDGFILANDVATLLDQNRQGEFSRENFRIGRRSLLTVEAFRGEIAEVVGFSGEFVGAEREGLLQYLRRKYNIIPRPAAAMDNANAIPALQVLIDGQPATGLHWQEDGSLGFTAPPYTGTGSLPRKVDVTLELTDGTSLTMSQAFTYRTQTQAWQLTHFGDSVYHTELESSLWGWQTDPDNDGLSNLMEYALDANPLGHSHARLPILSDASGHMAITFLRARGDVQYTVWAGSDLQNWTAIATDPGTVGQTVTVTDPIALSPDQPSRFLRLQVEFP